MTTVTIPVELLTAFNRHCDDVAVYVDIAQSWPEGTDLRAGALAQAERSMALADALLEEAQS